MKKPALVIMAAGMGSRYGGLKQIDPLDDHGQIIMDFSIYDALRAGFDKIVFIIKKEIEKDFKDSIGDRISKVANVRYVYQELDKLPKTEDNRYSIPDGRTKPWGTGHAVLCCKGVLDEPFAVINADDYYGPEAFKLIAEELEKGQDENTNDYCMVGYILSNTLTENGTVSRGVCGVDENGYLKTIEEKTKIAKCDDGAQYSEDDGKTWQKISPDSIVSMNMWGFKVNFLDELENSFVRFLDNDAGKNPLKSEFFLPKAVEEQLEKNKATVKVLKSTDKWFGVTYKEDKADVVNAIRQLKEKGVYPDRLWEEA